jgi:heme-degrading monooxygenase HmoA
MIVRILTGHVRAPDAPAVVAVLRATLTEMQDQPGLEYVKLARRLVDDGEDIVLIEEWATPANLYDWTGGDLRRPRLQSDISPLIHNLVITHFESLDRTPAERGLDVVGSEEGPESGAAQH